MKKPLSLYIHIPFCVRKCAYCDFLSFPADAREREQYLDALICEIRTFAPSVADRTVVSVFLGGGTPSLLTETQLKRLMDAVYAGFSLQSDAEITIEANPGTLTAHKLFCLAKMGINRLSLGLQSARNEELRLLGRIHTYEEFLDTYRLAGEAGFENINVDLMSALPGQTFAAWQETLERVAALSPAHISAYSLMIEEGTPFFETYHEEDEKRRRGEATALLPDEDTERKMYRWTDQFLREQGYVHYEISNFAKPGMECVHNIGYWIRREYAGFGLGAASLLEECRFTNTTDRNAYRKQGRSAQKVQKLTEEDRMEELMFLGLRMMSGVEKKRFLAKTGVPVHKPYGDVISLLRSQGLLEEDEDYLRLTARGIDLGNYCMAQFLL